MGAIFPNGGENRHKFQKNYKMDLKMFYFTTLYCWLTLGATTVNISDIIPKTYTQPL